MPYDFDLGGRWEIDWIRPFRPALHAGSWSLPFQRFRPMKEVSMTSSFTVHDASGYEQLMGRWSKKLAPPFIDFVGLSDGEKVLDVGCGTGSLTFTLAERAHLSEISAIDY